MITGHSTRNPKPGTPVPITCAMAIYHQPLLSSWNKSKIPRMWQTASHKAPRYQLLVPVLAFALVPNISLQAQKCEETAQSQIRDALDKTTNRILLREVIDDYGEEGKQILVQIAGDSTQTPRRRGQALQLLGEHRSEEGEKLLLAMLDDPGTICSAVNPLQEYRDPELIPKLIVMLDDHRSCGEVVRFSIGSTEKEQKTEIYLPMRPWERWNTLQVNGLNKSATCSLSAIGLFNLGRTGGGRIVTH